MPSQSVGAFVATGRTPGTRPTLSLDVSGTGTAQAMARAPRTVQRGWG